MSPNCFCCRVRFHFDENQRPVVLDQIINNCHPGCTACCLQHQHQYCSSCPSHSAASLSRYTQHNHSISLTQLSDSTLTLADDVDHDHPLTSIQPGYLSDTPSHHTAISPAPRLSLLDRFLTVWILLAMVLGILIGYLDPNSANRINSWGNGTTNIPIAIGLILMMYPPLARVKYDEILQLITGNTSMIALPPHDIQAIAHDASSPPPSNMPQPRASPRRTMARLLIVSLVQNWIIGPFLMFFLAVACLPDYPEYVRGLIIVGLARCIAVVIVWNTLAFGSTEYAAILVCLNSVFQILVYSPYAYLLVSVLLPVFHLSTSSIHVGFLLILESVAIYLGIPFLCGFASWLIIPRVKGKERYYSVFVLTLALSL